MSEKPSFPRQLGKGLYWLGGCVPVKEPRGLVHSYTSAFLVKGSHSSILVDTGNGQHWQLIEAMLDKILGNEQLTYIFPTHAEYPHMANTPRLAQKYPDSLICGDTRSLHLFWPELASRLVRKRPGETIDLGGNTFVFVDSAIRDLPATLWGYDTLNEALYVSDGLGFSHDHDPAECALTAEELPVPPGPEDVALLNDTALYWMRFTDLSVPFERLDRVLSQYPPKMIMPGHGSAIMDPEATVPVIKAGMVATRERTRQTG